MKRRLRQARPPGDLDGHGISLRKGYPVGNDDTGPIYGVAKFE